MEEVYVAKSEHDKKLQRALLQYFNSKNRKLVEEALIKAGRRDLIGFGASCLIKPDSRNSRPIKRSDANYPNSRNSKKSRRGRR